MVFRKGELTSSQIIAIVLGVGGFIIVLLFVALLYDTNNPVDTETCKFSIVSRATAPSIVQASIPLKCTTGKMCLTTQRTSSCKEFIGEKSDKVLLTGSSIEQQAQIQQHLANAMYDCWSMMGQGKFDLFGQAADALRLNAKEATCVVCSRVAFAEDIPSSVIAGAYAGLDTYLQTTNVPGQPITYLAAFTDRGTNTFPSTRELSEAPIVKDPKGTAPSAQVDAISTALSTSGATGNYHQQIAFLFSQIKVEDTGAILERWGAMTAGSIIVAPGSSTFKGVVGLLGGTAAVIVNEFGSKTAATGYCGDFTSSDKATSGCSLVQSVPYSVNVVNKLCPSIQGSP